MFRRLMMVIVFVYMNHFSYFQCQFMLLASLIQLCYLFRYPYLDRSENNLEIFNEICVFVLTHSFSIYMDPLNNDTLRNYNGYFLILMFFIVIIGNIFKISKDFVNLTITTIKKLMAKNKFE